MTHLLRTLIVDDEAPARARLRQLLDEVAAGEGAGVEVVGEAASGPEALAVAERCRSEGRSVGLVFVDVQMPQMDGMELLRRLGVGSDAGPLAILTTAYDQYAVAAFELGALDYLRKPFGAARVAAALRRVRAQGRTDGADEAPTGADGSAAVAWTERLRWAAAALSPSAGPLTRLFVRDRGRIAVLRTDDVERLEGEDDYVAVHARTPAGMRSHLVYLTLQEFERRLDPTRFLRVHRSHIVNLDHLVMLDPFDATRLRLTLRSGAHVVANRACSRDLRRLII